MNLLKTEIDIVKNENNSLKSELHEKFDDLKTVTENVVDVIAKSFMVKMQLQQDTFEEKTNMLLNSLEGQIANMVSVLSKSNYIASSSEASSNHQANSSPRRCDVCQESLPTTKALSEHRKNSTWKTVRNFIVDLNLLPSLT